MVWRTSQWNLCKISLYRKWILSSERAKWVFSNFQQKNTLFGKTNYGIFHYSLRVIDEPKMSEIRILNLCHKKSILVDIYRQWLLNSFVSWKNRRRCLADTLNDTWPVLFHISYREIPLRPYSYIFTADLTFASSECSQSSFYLFLILPFQGRHWPSLPSDVLWGSFVTHSFLPVRGGEMNAWPPNPKGRLRGICGEATTDREEPGVLTIWRKISEIPDGR